MKMATEEEEMPESGAVFTFGRSRFADNRPSRFWIRKDPVVLASCGDEHTAIVTASGRLYTFGVNEWGQLGLGGNKPQSRPTFVKGLKQTVIQLVACGRSHTIAASADGELYSFGSNSEGQLGLAHNINTDIPAKVATPQQKFIQLSCGSEHSAALTDQGVVMMWGSNADGQLGLGDTPESVTPVALEMRERVASVSCGYYHTAFVTDHNQLWVCGEADGGKLGLEDPSATVTKPCRVSRLTDPVRCVACGNGHTAVISTSGHLYTFGSGDRGQLGQGATVMSCRSPQVVPFLAHVHVQLVCCGDSHTVVVTDKGVVFSFGEGRNGKLGLSEEDFANTFTPQKIPECNSLRVKSVACGGCHTMILAVRGDSLESGGTTVQNDDVEEEEEEDDLALSSASSAMGQVMFGRNSLQSTSPVSSLSARDRRRVKELSRTGSVASSTGQEREDSPCDVRATPVSARYDKDELVLHSTPAARSLPRTLPPFEGSNSQSKQNRLENEFSNKPVLSAIPAEFLHKDLHDTGSSASITRRKQETDGDDLTCVSDTNSLYAVDSSDSDEDEVDFAPARHENALPSSRPHIVSQGEECNDPKELEGIESASSTLSPSEDERDLDEVDGGDDDTLEEGDKGNRVEETGGNEEEEGGKKMGGEQPEENSHQKETHEGTDGGKEEENGTVEQTSEQAAQHEQEQMSLLEKLKFWKRKDGTKSRASTSASPSSSPTAPPRNHHSSAACSIL